MRAYLLSAAAGASLALAACTQPAGTREEVQADRTADAGNAAADRGPTLHIDREGARADLAGNEIRIGANGVDIDLGGRAIEARVRADENGSVLVTTNDARRGGTAGSRKYMRRRTEPLISINHF